MNTELLRLPADAGRGENGSGAGTALPQVLRAADLLRQGKLVAFPTDTVYGVAATADQPDAVTQLYVVKGRPSLKAIPILIADVEDLGTIVAGVNDPAQRLIDRFWPGGLTLVLPKRDSVPSQISPSPSIAVRLPDLPLTRQVIRAAGHPLAVTSANRSGEPSPRTASEVLAQLGGRIAAVLDGGRCPGGVPSTVLDCTVDPPRILRPGAISARTLLEVVPIA